MKTFSHIVATSLALLTDPALPAGEALSPEETPPPSNQLLDQRSFYRREDNQRFAGAVREFVATVFTGDPLVVYAGLSRQLEAKFAAQMSSAQRQEFNRLFEWREKLLLPGDGRLYSGYHGAVLIDRLQRAIANVQALRPVGVEIDAGTFAQRAGLNASDSELAASFFSNSALHRARLIREFLELSDLSTPRANALAIAASAHTTPEDFPLVFDKMLQSWSTCIEQQKQWDLASNLAKIGGLALFCYATHRYSRHMRSRESQKKTASK